MDVEMMMTTPEIAFLVMLLDPDTKDFEGLLDRPEAGSIYKNCLTMLGAKIEIEEAAEVPTV